MRTFSVLAAAWALGCGGAASVPPPPADDAKAALVRTLDAWRGGTPPTALAAGSPALIASDHEWSGGAKLLAYRIQGAGEPFGADRRFRVELDLESAGRKAKSAASYLVATRTPLTVLREDD